MNAIKKIFLFIENGISVFRAASRGEYYGASLEMNALRNQLLKKTSPLDDRVNLKNDLCKVYGDFHISFSKLTMNHG